MGCLSPGQALAILIRLTSADWSSHQGLRLPHRELRSVPAWLESVCLHNKIKFTDCITYGPANRKVSKYTRLTPKCDVEQL